MTVVKMPAPVRSVTGFAGGRPKTEEIVAYWPALIDKTVVQTKVTVLE